MNSIRHIIDRMTGGSSRRARQRAARRFRNAGGPIQAAASGPVQGWPGIRSTYDEDAANKEYLYALYDVLQRSQDLDINNPDLRGFHRTRTAQILGSHVRFKSSPRAEEIGLSPAAAVDITSQVDRIRELHSLTGGFDATGHERSEGVQQVRAMLTAMIHGTCLVHRVWRPENPMLPLSLELIPGVRISTPYDRQGDPKLSYGIEYQDTYRTRVVAFHVRRVSKTVGNSFVSDFTWDRLPVEDCSLISLIEPAGMDRSMPVSIACVRMLRNRGEFVEASVSSARTQSSIYAQTVCAEGSSPFDVASDDSDQSAAGPNGAPLGFTDMGGVKMIYSPAGEVINWNSAKLPEPDFKDFMDVTDSRLARGMASAKSRFTREVNSSWAGGRMEDQQDDPIIDQYREVMVTAWQKINGWFLEAIWLAGKLQLPNYSTATQVYWARFRAEFPGKLHINPTDTMNAREKGFMLRTTTPQQGCEEDGKDFRQNLEQWAQAIKITRDTEKKYGLKEGTLDILLSGKTLSTSAGDEIGAPTPAVEPQPGEAPAKKPAAQFPRISEAV